MWHTSMAQPTQWPYGATISPHNLQLPSDCSNSWQGQKLANDQSVQGGIFAHTSLPISTPCSLPAAENLGLYIIFPQQQPPSLISVWKLWRSTGNRKKNHPPVTVLLILTAPIRLKLLVTHPWASGDPAQDLPLDSGKETMWYTTHEAYGFPTHDCIIYI